MIALFVQVIKVLLPCIAAGAVVRYINVQNEKKQKEFENINKENADGEKVVKYEIAYPPVVYGLMYACLIFFSGLFIYAYIDNQLDWFTGVGLGIFIALGLSSVLGTHVWKIWVNGEQIIYRGYNGIEHYYTFSDITRVTEKVDGAYEYYAEDKKLFKIDNNLIEGAKLTGQLIRKGVPCDLEGMSINSFTLKPQTVYWAVSAMCAGGFALLLGILIKQNETDSVYFMPLLICVVISLLLLLDLLCDRFSIKDGEVIRRRGIFTKRFQVEEIENVRIHKGLFRENLEFYVKGKKVTKVWTKNRPYELLRQRLAKEKVAYKR